MDIDLPKAAAHPFAAGLLGAFIGLRFAPGAAWWERVSNVFAGAACAGYIGPAAAEMFGLTTAPMQSALSFMLGMFGMSLAAAIFAAVREVPLAGIITKWLGGIKGDKP